MIPRVIGSMMILLISSNAFAQEIKPLGSFENVRSSDGGEHCYGYSLEIWQYRDQLLGLLDIHKGLCGDPPCGVLQDVLHDVKTGRLIFWTQIGERWDFVGTLKRDSVVGTLNGQSIHLAQNQNWVGSDANRSQTLGGWCDFWSAIPRCKGVRELCDSLKTQK
jgi:hypothetical protein